MSSFRITKWKAMQGSLNRDPLPCSTRTEMNNVHGASCIDEVYHGDSHCWEHPSNGFFLG